MEGKTSGRSWRLQNSQATNSRYSASPNFQEKELRLESRDLEATSRANGTGHYIWKTKDLRLNTQSIFNCAGCSWALLYHFKPQKPSGWKSYLWRQRPPAKCRHRPVAQAGDSGAGHKHVLTWVPRAVCTALPHFLFALKTAVLLAETLVILLPTVAQVPVIWEESNTCIFHIHQKCTERHTSDVYTTRFKMLQFPLL